MGISAGYDREQLINLLAAQYDVVTRRQLIDCGMTRSAIQYRVRPGGDWKLILPGVYSAHSGPIHAAARELAALLYAGTGALMTGAFAARRLGLVAPGPDSIEILVPANVRRQSIRFVRLIHTTRMPSTTIQAGPIAMAPPARAVADAVRGYRTLNEARTVVCGALQRGHCTIEELGTELREGPRRGAAILLQALRDTALGVWSAAEGDFAAIIGKSGLEPPEYNMALYTADGSFLGIVDAWWQRAGVAAEVDSQEFHFSRDAWADTMKRHNRITSQRIQLMHFAPHRIRTEKSAVIAELRDAIAAGRATPPLAIRAVPAAEARAASRAAGQADQLRERHALAASSAQSAR